VYIIIFSDFPTTSVFFARRRRTGAGTGDAALDDEAPSAAFCSSKKPCWQGGIAKDGNGEASCPALFLFKIVKRGPLAVGDWIFLFLQTNSNSSQLDSPLPFREKGRLGFTTSD
jgi:hypothetical protein